MEKRVKPKMYVIILLLSTLAVLFLFSSVSPLYWYVYEDKDAWCYLYGLMGVNGDELYSDYIEAVGPFFDIYNKTAITVGGKYTYFVIDIIIMSFSVIYSMILAKNKRVLSKHILPDILVFMILYVSVANQVGMVDRVFGIGAWITIIWMLEESLIVPEKKKVLFIFTAGVIFSMALFTRFNIILLVVPIYIIIRKKIKAVSFLYGIVLFSFFCTAVIVFRSYGIRDLLCWWVKSSILDYHGLIWWLYPVWIYIYTHYIGVIRRLCLASDVTDHKTCFNRFLCFSIVMIPTVVFSLLIIFKMADRNISYVFSGYEYGRYNAYKQLLETIPEDERNDIMGLGNTVGFFVSNDIVPANRPVVVRNELYKYDTTLLKKRQKDIFVADHLWVICNIAIGRDEKSQRDILKKYYVVESAASGFQVWKRR